MDDKHLTTLVEMASESESFERVLLTGAGTGAGTDVGMGREAPMRGRRRSRLGTRLVGGVALLGMGAMVVAAVNLGGAIFGLQSPARSTPRAAGPTLPEHQNMLIALYRADEAGGQEPAGKCPECWCVQRWKPEWGVGRDLGSVRDDELIGASMERACVASPASMVVIGLSGPAESLPASDEQAREVAMCILDQAEPSGAGCLASNVDVRVETWKR